MKSVSRQDIADDLDLLDRKMKQLKNEYDQYFLGSRPREPVLLRGEVQKLVNIYSNRSIQHTALRFRFSNLAARYFTLKRQWDRTLRQIEEGTYERHRFKVKLRERQAQSQPAEKRGAPSTGDAGNEADEIFRAYVRARRECGEDVAGLTPARMRQVLEKQRDAIRQKLGCEKVRFRVVVENGRTKLKASAAE